MNPARYDLGLVACTRAKNPTGINARTLYRGGTFSLIMRHAMQRCDRVMIMSGKYGLLNMDDPIRYYDTFVNTLTAEERAALIERCRVQLQPLRGLRVLSYLWIPYYSLLLEADATIAAGFHRPYNGLPTMPATLQKTLTREVTNYGTHPSRR